MTALFYLGCVVALIGGIWLLVVTYKKSVWWGLGSLFIPLVGLIFVIMNWQLTKTPFLVYLGGVVLLVIGAMNMPEFAAQMPT